MQAYHRAVAGAVAAIGVLGGSAVLAQDEDSYPTKPVAIVVPFPAGGGTDLNARMVAEKLTAALGQNFIVNEHQRWGEVIRTLGIKGN